MAKLIRTHLGNGLQEAEPIVKLLSDAIGPCDQRNFLAHGEWCCFNTSITLRSGTRWNDGQPEHVEYTAQEIEALVGEFERLEIAPRRAGCVWGGASAPPPRHPAISNHIAKLLDRWVCFGPGRLRPGRSGLAFLARKRRPSR
jgi:hypothetical protein